MCIYDAHQKSDFRFQVRMQGSFAECMNNGTTSKTVLTFHTWLTAMWHGHAWQIVSFWNTKVYVGRISTAVLCIWGRDKRLTYTVWPSWPRDSTMVLHTSSSFWTWDDMIENVWGNKKIYLVQHAVVQDGAKIILIWKENQRRSTYPCQSNHCWQVYCWLGGGKHAEPSYMICHFACFDPRNALVKFMLRRILKTKEEIFRILENMLLAGNQCMEEN